MSRSGKQEENKVKEVAALQYSAGECEAPKIIALGKGEIAEKILVTARENDVPVFQDAKLAHTLNALNIGSEIPNELYEVVAEILVFVNSLDKSYGEKYGNK